ncbi:hypothetical protein ACS0PU_000004 [Formica fusca]
MPNQKRYDNLSKRQIYRRLDVQSKADLHDLHDSSLEFTNEPESADDICYIRQELPKGKNNLHVRIDDESEGTHDFIENMIEIENIQLNYENEIIQSMMSDGKYYETDSEEEFQEDNLEFGENDAFNFVEELKLFAVHSEIKHVHLNCLLKLLKKAGFNNLPKDSRSLLKTPRTSYFEISSCPPGEYLHYGLKKAIENQLYGSTCIDETELMLDLNIDGLPIAKSSGACLWPILGKLVHSSLNTPFVIGIYHGNKKPSSVHKYLAPFINEYKQLQDEGIVINRIKYNVTLRCIICDSPARSYVKCTKQFNGYFSCDKCNEEGEFRDRMVFLSESASLRTDDTFRSRMNEEHHIGISPFESLPIDMIKQFPLDSLHVVFLGVMKSLLMSWLDNRRCPKFYSPAIQKLSDSIVIAAQWVPKEFNRKPRGLQELCRWKGTEFRLFVLYLGPIILQHFLPRKYLIHFNSLNCAMRILCDPRDCYKNNIYAKELLIYFVQQFKILYGEQYVTSNFHYLIHLNQDVKMYGPLDSYSTFDFENYMQVLKRMLRKYANPLQQIHRRLSEKHNRDQHLQKKNPKILKYPLLKNPVVSELPLGCHNEHRFLQFRMFELSNKRPDNCCFMIDGTIVMIKHIGLRENMIVVFGSHFLKKHDISNYPCPSSNMNIYKVGNLSPVQIWPVQCISRKGFLLTFENITYAMPLLHD